MAVDALRASNTWAPGIPLTRLSEFARPPLFSAHPVKPFAECEPDPVHLLAPLTSAMNLAVSIPSLIDRARFERDHKFATKLATLRGKIICKRPNLPAAMYSSQFKWR